MIAGGVLVRDRSHDPYSPNCFRITVGLVEHTAKAVAVLETLCAKR
jgi:histidinol-phosphate/aromatic aminotransferase/cobyric acid decarboxylase-like protein